jgi:hypothetical protein
LMMGVEFFMDNILLSCLGDLIGNKSNHKTNWESLTRRAVTDFLEMEDTWFRSNFAFFFRNNNSIFIVWASVLLRDGLKDSWNSCTIKPLKDLNKYGKFFVSVKFEQRWREINLINTQPKVRFIFPDVV